MSACGVRERVCVCVWCVVRGVVRAVYVQCVCVGMVLEGGLPQVPRPNPAPFRVRGFRAHRPPLSGHT